MPDVKSTTGSHDPHGTVSGKKVLLGTGIGCVVLFFVVWASLRGVEYHLGHSRAELSWSDRADWIAPAVIETTLVKPNAENAQYTYNKPRYRDPGLMIPAEEEQTVLGWADIARSDTFTQQATLDEIGQLTEDAPHFYADYLLGTWFDSQGDDSTAHGFYQNAADTAPKIIVIQYTDMTGHPVAGLSLGTIEIGCDRVTEGGVQLDQRLVLAYPLQKTDAAGRVYLPVYDTTYRPVSLPQPAGYDIVYRPKEGWFSLPSRLGTISATVYESEGK